LGRPYNSKNKKLEENNTNYKNKKKKIEDTKHKNKKEKKIS
jgi:hypothetical protein